MAEPLFEYWSEVRARISTASQVLLACDFDGTVSSIVLRPEDATILPECVEALRDVAALPSYEVAILSGRALADVRARAGLPEAFYSGNHGMEIEGPGLTIRDEAVERAQHLMVRLREALQPVVAEFSGAFVEDKGVSLSVHHRMTPESLAPQVRERVSQVVAHAIAGENVIVVQGKKVLDVRLRAAWDKGAALRALVQVLSQRSGGTPRLPIYVGDDATDEDAFREVNRMGGVSVLVGPAEQKTEAEYRIDSPVDVAGFLRRLTEMATRD